ncbi:rhodanese-like domain-containing protein [Exiguobacterium aurantiacum]|uniref:Rhodanese-like domain-containing protein n=1 Tax=Exiguobacterium aurantiacum TaxID=33987 RepID=A0ABY5FL99_9BACL|nr:rhodanese-like domain-containing protein [Exiguobacterium aurantiacum]UTT42165.1 rhodanese-like domain-containing protein [Exiguobacterium aurantiacum]
MKKLMLILSILVLTTIGIVLFTSEESEITKIDVETLQNRLENEEITLLDVREVDEYEGGHIEGAVNAPLSSLNETELPYPKDEPIYVICRSGNRSAQAAQLLKQRGYTEIYDVSGGMIAWEQK